MLIQTTVHLNGNSKNGDLGVRGVQQPKHEDVTNKFI